ncbi:DNA internalization-related competence protein ComEC/Rec2 [Ruminococcaceae bacterium YRB3002]|nr:DNA internalization-related competence protein ComEC/Rec2 [Ruminococcaceae bacterium YRB3002]
MSIRNETVWNKIMERPLLPVAGLMLTGVVITYFTGSAVPFALVIAVLLILTIVFTKSGREYILFVLASLILVMIPSIHMALSLEASEDTGRISTRGTVVSVRRKLNGGAEDIVRISSGALVLLRCDEEAELVPGSTLVIAGTLSLPDKAGNPGEFDYREYLRKKGISCVLRADSVEITHNPSVCGHLNSLVFDVRKNISGLISENMDSDTSSLITALCLGDHSLLSDDIKYRFSITNCSHLIAVSGTHFAGFASLFACIDPGDRRRKIYRIMMITVYMAAGLLTGMSESVTRAMVMSIGALLSRDKLSGMCMASVFLVMADPWSGLSSGYGMSVSSCLGIILFGPVIRQWLLKHCRNAALSDIFSAAAGAHIGLMPFFGTAATRLSVTNLLCQLAGGFTVSIICMIFIPVVLLSLAGFPVVMTTLELLGKLLLFMVGTASETGYMSFNCGRYGKYVFTGIYILLIVLIIPKGRLRRILFLPGIAACALSLGIIAGTILFRPDVTVVFLDVGQGDSCLVMAGKRSILIDGGTEDNGKVISDVMDWYGIDKIDIAFVSHWDSDHYGGVMALNDMGRIRMIEAPAECIFQTGETHDTDNVMVTGAGDRYTITECVKAEILSPNEAILGDNDESLVMTLECDDLTILFTGDISTEKENDLISSGILVDCDILKVAHHGSKYSTSAGFLEQVEPETAIISCGRYNSYGHPHRETLERLYSENITVRRTDREGAIIFEINHKD